MTQHEREIMRHLEREARRAVRSDWSAIYRGLVLGLLAIIAAHAMEQSHETGLLGQAFGESR